MRVSHGVLSELQARHQYNVASKKKNRPLGSQYTRFSADYYLYDSTLRGRIRGRNKMDEPPLKINRTNTCGRLATRYSLTPSAVTPLNGSEKSASSPPSFSYLFFLCVSIFCVLCIFDIFYILLVIIIFFGFVFCFLFLHFVLDI